MSQVDECRYGAARAAHHAPAPEAAPGAVPGPGRAHAPSLAHHPGGAHDPVHAPGAAGTTTGTHPATAADLAHGVERVTLTSAHLLRELVAEQRHRAAALDVACADLWDDVEAVVGGKLMRPRLAAAAYLGLGGTDPLAAAHVAAAHELLHTAMLVHDDLLDHDEVRRGHPNVAGRARARLDGAGVPAPAAREQAGAAALLAGDAALAQSFALLAAASAPPTALGELVRLLADGVSTTVAGELLDVRGALQAPADVDALLVAELKTAAYSFRVPLESGAVLAGATSEQRRALAGFGTALGVAYQLVDDELGVVGDPAVTGKSVLSDLREGKRTQLLRVAWQRADAAQAAVLRAHVGDPGLDECGAAAVRDVLRETGALDDVRRSARRHADTARTLATTLPEPLATYLSGVVDDLAGRAR